MSSLQLKTALDELGQFFDTISWQFRPSPDGDPNAPTQLWPGSAEDDIMICVYKGCSIEQDFHRQDYFFFNFAYQGNYGALSARFDRRITVHEGECYIGQPYAGYAPNGKSAHEIIIVGVLIRKDAFFKTFLPVLSADSKLFHFFLTPQINAFSDEYIHLAFEDPLTIRCLLELMVIEYARPKENTQEILKSFTLALLMLVAREYSRRHPAPEKSLPIDRILRYIAEHSDNVTLAATAARFGYHPNYLSGYIRRQTGKRFSELVLEQRMQRAAALITGTDLSIEEIAPMLGYTSNSNFYKAFRHYYGVPPREYAADRSQI